MKIIKLIIFSVFITIIVSSVSQVLIGEEQTQSQEDQKMMRLWMEYATPGDYHKYLESFTGDWDTTAKIWMKPGAEPEVSNGVTKSIMILGGRYLKSSYNGEMMGIPFEGISITGFDNYKKEFATIWLDTAGTGIYSTYGILSKDGKIRTETGLWDDIMTGEKTKVRWVTTTIDKDKYVFEMFDTDTKTGKERKSGEIVYIRKN